MSKKAVVIVGGGIAGLTVAYRLRSRPDLDVTLVEKEEVAGGRARRLALPEGFWADDSAQFFTSGYRCILQLMDELGIRDELVTIDHRTFTGLYRDGRIALLPATALGFVRTDAFSLREKLSLLRLGVEGALRYRCGALIDPSRLLAHDDTPLADYIRDRFGERLLDQVVDPMVGVSMGTADEVSLAYGLAMAPIALDDHYVLPQGNGLFTERLAQACEDVRLGARAKRIVIENDHVRGVELESGEKPLPADFVVGAVPAHDAASLLPDLPAKLRQFLESVPYSVCVQVLFGTQQPYLPCWGVPMPRTAGTFLRSITEETFKAKTRAPAGQGLTQVFVVGDAAAKLLEKDDETIGHDVLAELRRLFSDYPDRVLFSRVIRRQEAMVLGEPGYQRRRLAFNRELAAIGGLTLISDYQSNPLMEASAQLGERAARQIGEA